jgi:hypothetical protein
MREFKKVKIQELIDKHPEVLNVLKEFDLPCQTCKVRNCYTKDIAEYENLTLENEMKFIAKISDIVSVESKEE